MYKQSDTYFVLTVHLYTNHKPSWTKIIIAIQKDKLLRNPYMLRTFGREYIL